MLPRATLLAALAALGAATRPQAAAPAGPLPELAGSIVGRSSSAGIPRFDVSGCARFAADGRACAVPLQADSLMRVASITKFATALGVMRLVEEGRLDLEEDVSARLGFPLRNPAYPDRVISLRELLTHTSSLLDGENYFVPRPEPIAGLIGMPGRWEAGRGPGECTRYANLNTFLVGAIIESATGELFEQYLQRAVLDPLRLEAGINWYSLQRLDPRRVAAIYGKDENARGASDPWVAAIDDFGGGPPVRNPALLSPQGGLRISAAGLMHLARQLLPAGTQGVAPLLRPTTLDLMLAPALTESGPPACDPLDKDSQGRFGLGVQVLNYGGRVWTGHLGEAYGLRGGLLVDRASGEILVYLINGSAEPLPGDQAILKMLGAL